MNGVNAVRATGLLVELVATHSSVWVSFKKVVECFFLVGADVHWEPFYMDLALSIVLDWDLTAILLVSWRLTYKVKHQLIIDFNIGDSNGHLLIESAANLLENLSYGPRDKPPVLVILCGPGHGKGFTSTCLPVTHDGSVITISHWLDDVLGAVVEKFLLAWVVQDLVEFEFPLLLLVVYETSVLVLRDLQGYCL